MAGGGTISTSETKIESVRLQSSTYGAAIPLAYGVTRLAGNMLWYGGFKATAQTTKQRAGKGGGTTTKNTTYSYSAHVAMGLCEGPIIGIPRIWVGKAIESGGFTGAQILNTSQTYAVPGGGGSLSVTNAANWTNTIAVYYTGAVDVGDGSTTGPIYLAEGVDYTVAAGVYTFGAAFAGITVTVEYQYRSAGSETALAKLGLTKFSGRVGQGTWSLLTSSFSAQAVPYSGIAYVAAQDYPLPDATVQNHNFEVQAPLAYHLGSTIPDVDMALVALDVLGNARYGALFPAARMNFSLWSRYCRAAGLLMSPAFTEQMSAAEMLRTAAQLTNTAAVWSAGALKMIPYGDQALTGNGATYTPNVTPVYALDDSVLLPFAGNGEPIKQSSKPRADAWNHVRIEYKDRANDYNLAIAEAKDQADIDAFGLRSSQVITAHWIGDANVARSVAQLILQRSLYVRATYKFRLPWTFSLLEPMDLVTLTDPGIGLNATAVRIISIDEAEDGELELEAEEFPAGVAAAALYTPQVGTGYAANYNAVPGNVSAPVLFEAPAELTTTGLEVYAAVTGTSADWGGCGVWVSLDGTAFTRVGTVYGGARYGSLTAAISAGNLPVSILAGQIVAASAADAAALTSLCYIGGSNPEYLAHQGATLTGTLAYTLSGLVRAAYGTTSTAHATSDPFVRVDDAIGKSGPLPLSMVGKTITFKFTSFNVYGNAEQDLASVTAYTYTLTGYMASRGTARPKLVKVNADRQAITLDGTGALSPSTQTTTFTVTGQNLTTGTYTVSLARTDGTVLNANTFLTGSGTIGAVGNSFTMTGTTVTLTAANFQSARSAAAGVLVTIAHADGVQDTVQLTRVQDGAAGAAGSPGSPGTSAVSVTVDNESTSLVSYADGTVVSFAPAEGQLKVWNGTTDVTASATLSASAVGCTGTINTATGTPVAGKPAGYYRVTAMTADTATLTLTAVFGGNTFTRVFSVSKSRGGYEIVGTLPSTNLFEGRVVFLTTDDRLYRYTGSVWTAAVGGAPGAALNSDPSMSDPASWFPFSGQAVFATVTDGKVGNTVMRSSAAGVQNWMNERLPIPVDPSKTYRVRCWLRTVSGAGSTAYMGVALRDSAGAEIAGSGSQWFYAASNVTVPGAWTEYVGTFGAGTAVPFPTNGRTMTPLVILSYGGGTSIHEVQDLRIEEVIGPTLIAANAITADKINAGAVTAAKMSVTSLSSITANIGTVTAGVLQNAAGTSKFDLTNGRIVLDTGGYILAQGIGFGTTGQFIEWFGPRPSGGDLSLCSEATATSYRKTDGSAYFGGTLSAGILRNAATGTSIIATADVLVGPFLTNGGAKSCVLSYDYRYTYRCNAGTGGITGTWSATVVLEKSTDGTSWTTIATLNPTEQQRDVIVDGSPGVQDIVLYRAAGSTTVSDSSASSTTFRLRGRITARTIPTMNGTTKTSIVETQSITVVCTE